LIYHPAGVATHRSVCVAELSEKRPLAIQIDALAIDPAPHLTE